MVAGISGATPGSRDAEGEEPVKLMPLQAPRHIASAEATDRLATVRALSKLIIGFPPDKIVAAPVRSQAQNRCPSNNYARHPDLVSFSQHAISSLKKALTPL